MRRTRGRSKARNVGRSAGSAGAANRASACWIASTLCPRCPGSSRSQLSTTSGINACGNRTSLTSAPRTPSRTASWTGAAGIPTSRANSLASFSATSSPSERSRSGRAGLKSHVRFCEECLSQSCGCCPWVSRPATDQSSTQTTGQESGTNSLCREPRRRRIDQRANAPIWMPTVLDSGFDPAYWQLEATLSKITGTSKRQHP